MPTPLPLPLPMSFALLQTSHGRGLWVATIFGGKDWVRGCFSGWHVESFSALCGGCFSIINLTFAWHFLSDSAILFASLSYSLLLRSLASVTEAEVLHSRAVRHTQWAPHTLTHRHTHTQSAVVASIAATLTSNWTLSSEWVAYLCNTKVFLWHFYVVYRLAVGLVTLSESCWISVTTCEYWKELKKTKLKLSSWIF